MKSLWLPTFNLAGGFFVFDNDFNYRVRAYNLATLNVPVTGTYNFAETATFSQILATGGKRTSGLKQAKMFAEIKRWDPNNTRLGVARLPPAQWNVTAGNAAADTAKNSNPTSPSTIAPSST